jgi:hypothetical protein
VQAPLDGNGRAYGLPGVLFAGHGGAKQGHKPMAQELRDGAVIAHGPACMHDVVV